MLSLNPIEQRPLPAGPTAGAKSLGELVGRAGQGDKTAQKQLREAKDSGRLARAARMFEEQFIKWLLSEMRKTVPEGGLLPRGPAQEIYEDMLDRSLAEAISRGRGLGLAQAIEARLSAVAGTPEARPPSPSESPSGA